MTFKIELVNQDDDKSCVLACIAMVADVSIDTVRELCEIHEFKIPPSDFETEILLHAFKLYTNPQVRKALMFGRVYILTVPSLNFEATNHAIVVSTLDDVLTVFDPQKGRKGKKFYTADNLQAWSAPVEIIYGYY